MPCKAHIVTAAALMVLLLSGCADEQNSATKGGEVAPIETNAVPDESLALLALQRAVGKL